VITFTAYGVPRPQGSKRAFVRGKHAIIVEQCREHLKPWRQAVVDACRELMAGRRPMEGPIHLDVTFYLPRPKSWPKRITEHTRTPDRDKLLRALCDALTAAGAWHDDSQVVEGQTRKALAAGIHDPEGAAGVPRAVITAYEVPHQQVEVA